MNFAPTQPSSTDISPTRGVSRVSSSPEAPSSEEIINKLAEEKERWELMDHIGELFEAHVQKLAEITRIQSELQDGELSGEFLASQKVIVELQKQEQEIRDQIKSCEEKIDNIFKEREDDSFEVRDLIDKRRERLEFAHKKTCSIGGYETGYTQTPLCKEIDRALQEIEYQILAKRTEDYWSKHSLKNFVSTEDFPSPGYLQANAAFMDIKAIVDGSRSVAITSRTLEDGAINLLASPRSGLSKLFVNHPMCLVVYKAPEGYEKARAIVDLLENKQFQKTADSVYRHYMQLGKLLEENELAVTKKALEKARKIDPEFEVNN